MSTSSYEPISDVAGRIINNIREETADLSPIDRLMVLGYVAEHCKAYEQTVLCKLMLSTKGKASRD